MFGNLGRTLQLVRELHGLKQAEFARRAGVGKSQLSKYENGRELPKLAVLGRMLGTLGFSLKDFFQILEYIDRLEDQQGQGAPIVVPSSSSALLGAKFQEAFEKLLEDLLALQREVLMSFFLHRPP